MKTRKIIGYKDIAYYGAYGSNVIDNESTAYFYDNITTASITGLANQYCIYYINCSQTTVLSFYNNSTLVDSVTLSVGINRSRHFFFEDITSVEVDQEVQFGFVTFYRNASSVMVSDDYSHDNFSFDLEAVRESLQQRLSVIRGEIENNSQYGIPLCDKSTKAELDFAIVDIILETQGVREIVSFESAVSGREYHATFTVQTIYGELTISL